MSYYSFNRLYNTSDRDIKEMININDIMNIEKYCKEAEEDLKIIRQKLFEQVQEFNNITSEKYILIHRYKSFYQKHVEIYVYLKIVNKLKGYIKTDSIDYKKFTGKEKKQALLYADELKKKYNLKIIKENWI